MKYGFHLQQIKKSILENFINYVHSDKESIKIDKTDKTDKTDKIKNYEIK